MRRHMSFAAAAPSDWERDAYAVRAFLAAGERWKRRLISDLKRGSTQGPRFSYAGIKCGLYAQVEHKLNKGRPLLNAGLPFRRTAPCSILDPVTNGGSKADRG